MVETQLVVRQCSTISIMMFNISQEYDIIKAPQAGYKIKAKSSINIARCMICMTHILTIRIWNIGSVIN